MARPRLGEPALGSCLSSASATDNVIARCVFLVQNIPVVQEPPEMVLRHVHQCRSQIVLITCSVASSLPSGDLVAVIYVVTSH